MWPQLQPRMIVNNPIDKIAASKTCVWGPA